MGKTEPPVNWDFVMTVDAAEVWRLTRTIGNKQGMRLVGQYAKMRLFKPRELRIRYGEATKTRTGVNQIRSTHHFLGRKSRIFFEE